MSRFCPSCATKDQFTQEGLSATAIRLGYWRCLACGSLVKPIEIAYSRPEEEPQPAAG